MSEIPKSIWVGYSEDGYEGCSEPMRVFESKELAEIWLMGAKDNYGSSGVKIKELPITVSVRLLGS